MSKRTRKIMTEENFNTIKKLQDKLDEKEIAKLTGYSTTTVWRVLLPQNNTFADYSEYQSQRSRDRRYNTETTTPKEVNAADSLEKQLTRIADSMERLVKAWESTPSKRRLF